MSQILTNCGDIDMARNASSMLQPFINNHLNRPGNPSILKNRITYFHQMVCKWAYNIPLKCDWVLVMQPKGPTHRRNLLGKIRNIETGVLEERGWKVSRNAETTFSPDAQDTVGCIFAQAVTLPGESIKTSYAGISENNRGFINAPIANGRENFTPLTVGFLETNRSFVDSFLRPWAILVGHKGLIAAPTPDEEIKMDIYVHQLARRGTDQTSAIRKTTIFKNCAPMMIPKEDLTYGSSSDYPKMTVDFAYSNYYIA